MADFTIKRGDTRPALTAQLEDNGVPIDLTNATSVKMLMRLVGGQTAAVNAACSFVDRASGRIVYAWVSANTQAAGIYDVEFQITWGDGGIETVPNDIPADHETPYYTVEVKADLDASAPFARLAPSARAEEGGAPASATGWARS